MHFWIFEAPKVLGGVRHIIRSLHFELKYEVKKFEKTYQGSIPVSNLLSAWTVFVRDKKKKSDVATFQSRLMDNIMSLHTELVNKTYTHGPYHAFNISDPKPRNIHKATVRDRLLHHLLYQELYPYFDRQFIFDSYSCRSGKGTHRAVNRFRDFGRTVSKNNTKTCWVLKCDIKKFFASIDHVILRTILEKHIEDKDTLWLLGNIIDSFETEGKKGAGLPLGNLTSQLLVNVYMNEFDQYMKHVLKIKYYIRYADDFVILSRDKKELENTLNDIGLFLETKLKLALHPDKVFIKTLSSGVDFLGWVHFPTHRTLRTATKRRMMKNIRNDPTEGTLPSYRGMLSHGNAHKLQNAIIALYGS